MARYFLEVCYKGTRFAGFQVQANAITVQSEVERALQVYFREKVSLTGSSRTDAGVHARQNYFHFELGRAVDESCVYNLNAIVHEDIAVRRVVQVRADAHCRFDALWRRYSYSIYDRKDPFLSDRAYFFPYTLNVEALQAAAKLVLGQVDFESFAKRNAQNRTFRCEVFESEWVCNGGGFEYRVRANRFLRGMVRGLVGTMLKVGREKISVEEFGRVFEGKDATAADFAVPGHGLILEEIGFSGDYFEIV